jgi:hypothetical protein
MRPAKKQVEESRPCSAHLHTPGMSVDTRSRHPYRSAPSRSVDTATVLLHQPWAVPLQHCLLVALVVRRQEYENGSLAFLRRPRG